MTAEAFEKKVRTFAHDEHLWQKGDAILVAVSGGSDSLGLLLFLHAIAKKEGLRLGCCCVNHHLRQEAEQEAFYVASVAQKLHIPFYLRHVHVHEAQMEKKGSIETVARELRYKKLRQVKEEGHFGSIALAHHADDQAETILFHMLRGSGARGLSAMRPKRDDLIRPFLEVTKKEIASYLETFSCPFCHDASNDIPDTTRNKIRLQLLPSLLSYNPQLIKTLGHMAEILREEDDFLSEKAKEWLSSWSWQSTGGYLLISGKTFQREPKALGRRILMEAAQRVGHESLDFQSLERLRYLALYGTSGQKTSSARTILQKEGKDLFLYPGTTLHGCSMDSTEVVELLYKKQMEKQVDNIFNTDIIDNNRVQMQQGPWQITILSLHQKPDHLSRCQYVLDGDQVGHLRLTFSCKGDVIYPKGMEGTKTVDRLMQEAHIPSLARNQWPILADDKEIYWVAMIRGSRRALPTKQTRHFKLITLSWIGKE